MRFDVLGDAGTIALQGTTSVMPAQRLAAERGPDSQRMRTLKSDFVSRHIVARKLSLISPVPWWSAASYCIIGSHGTEPFALDRPSPEKPE